MRRRRRLQQITVVLPPVAKRYAVSCNPENQCDDWFQALFRPMMQMQLRLAIGLNMVDTRPMAYGPPLSLENSEKRAPWLYTGSSDVSQDSTCAVYVSDSDQQTLSYGGNDRKQNIIRRQEFVGFSPGCCT